MVQATPPNRVAENRKMVHVRFAVRETKRPPEAAKKPVQATSPTRGADNGKLVDVRFRDREAKRPPEADKKPVQAMSPNRGADCEAKLPSGAEKKLFQATSTNCGAGNRKQVHVGFSDREAKRLPEAETVQATSPFSDCKAKQSPEAKKKQLADSPEAETVQATSPNRGAENGKLVLAVFSDCKAKQPPEAKKKQLTDLDRVKRPIFAGFFFCLLGVSHTSEIHEAITSRGGKIVEASDFEVCTHLLINGYRAGMRFEGSKVVSKSWVKECCELNKVKPVPDDCMKVLCKNHHQLFVCPLDESYELFSLSKAAERCTKKTYFVITPGSHRETHRSLITDDFLTLLVKKSYILMRRLHQAGLTLNGSFDADKLIIYEALGEITVRFGYIHEDAVQPITSEGETLDIQRFEAMVRVKIFRESVPGPSLNLWLSMLHDHDVKDLLIDSVLLMNLQEQSEKFSSLYDSFLNSNSAVRDAVVIDLHQYSGWHDIINSSDCNFFLKDTFDHPENGKSGSDRYKNTVTDLLRLLRNSRHHDALRYSAEFALVIRHNFTNLLSDFQKSLFLARRRFP